MNRIQKLTHTSKHLWLIVAVLAASPAISGETRRCLLNGKVVITDVGCEVLGNAQDLSPPIPKNKVQRGIPESRPYAPGLQTQQAGRSSPITPPTQVRTPPRHSFIDQVLGQLFKTLFLPMIMIFGLVAWLSRKAKHSWKRKQGEVLINGARDHLISGTAESTWRKHRHEPSWNAKPAADTIDKPAAWSLSLIRDLEWKRYEDVCQKYYELKGIHSETTPLGADGGIDIRLYQDESGKPTALVQCKSWNERVVGVSLIRELLGAMAHEKIAKGYFMATSSFSDDAKAFASANQITLIDGPMLLMMIERLPTIDQETLLAFAIEGDYQTPTCPSCGAKMVSITGSLGKADFWGCPRYPKCRGKLGKRRT